MRYLPSQSSPCSSPVFIASAEYCLAEETVMCQLFQTSQQSLLFGVRMICYHEQQDICPLSSAQAECLYELLVSERVSPTHLWDILEDLAYEDIRHHQDEQKSLFEEHEPIL